MDKMKSLFLSSLLVVVSTSGLAQNPIIQTNYTADPAPMVYNDKVYLYTTHDEDNSTWFTMNDWRLYTTSDMVNWTDHGAVLSYTDFKWAKGDAWAPQCIERDGKFYMYVPMISNINNRGAIGVAVADSPYGPFYDPLLKMPSANRFMTEAGTILILRSSLMMTVVLICIGEIRISIMQN